jgi:hypothetical protein
MMARERLMARMVEQRPGVMVAAPLIALMAAQLPGVMVPAPLKVRVVALRAGIVALVVLQPQLAEHPEAGAGKRFILKTSVDVCCSPFVTSLSKFRSPFYKALLSEVEGLRANGI